MGGRGSGSGRGGGALPKEQVKEMLYRDFMNSGYSSTDTVKESYNKEKKTILVKTNPRLEAVEKLIPESTMRKYFESKVQRMYPNASSKTIEANVQVYMNTPHERRFVAREYYSVLENAAFSNKKLNKKNPSWIKKAYKIVKG